MTPAEFKEARHKLGLTQTELAEVLNYQQAHISRMESGAMPVKRATEIAMLAMVAGFRPPGLA